MTQDVTTNPTRRHRRGSSVRARILGRPWEQGLPRLVLLTDVLAVLLLSLIHI